MDFTRWILLLNIPFLLLAIAFLLYIYATRHFTYWHSKGISYFKPIPFIGNLKEVVTFQRNIGFHLKHLYDSIKGQPYMGFFIFDQPVLLVKDLDLLKSILQKDFQHFVDKGISLTKKDKLLGDALFCLKENNWKSIRTKISPGFSTSKLKSMYEIVDEKANMLIHYLDNTAKSEVPVFTKDICGRYTTDIVSSLAFGFDCNSLQNPNADFRRYLKRAFLYSKTGAMKFIGAFVDLPLFKLWPVITAPVEAVQFFQKSVWNIVRERQSKIGGITRNDYLEGLIRVSSLQNSSKECSENPNIDIVSQAFTFLAAGFETTSSTILSTLYHLALDTQIQNKLRCEIQEAREQNDGILSYNVVHSLIYLDKVISETLRLYPTMPMIDRTCTIPYKIPGTNIIIDKGTHVFTSLIGIHRDHDLYPNPDIFDPERFSEENKKNRHKFAYMPFGEGPRICIGKRMGLMIVKNAISHIILNYEVLPCKDTPKQLEFDVHTFLLSTSHDIPLIFNKVI